MRVQRFSTDWHANSFAGSIVRKIARGMWALDLLDDTIPMALLPSLVVLLGSMILLGLHWSEDITMPIRETDKPLYGQLCIINALCEHDEGLAAQTPAPKRQRQIEGQQKQAEGHAAGVKRWDRKTEWLTKS
jgi:hypothetical protein